MGAFVTTMRGTDSSAMELITAIRRDLAMYIVPNNDDELTLTVRVQAIEMLDILTASPYKLLPKMSEAVEQETLLITEAIPESHEGFGMTLAEFHDAFPDPNRLTFFDLPPEIRLQIYREVVRSNKEIALMRHIKHEIEHTARVIRVECEDARIRRSARRRAPDLDEVSGKLVRTIPSSFTLLRVCRTFYEEAGPVAYGENIFRFMNRITAEQWLGGIGEQQLKWLRYVAFELHEKADISTLPFTKASLATTKLISVVLPARLPLIESETFPAPLPGPHMLIDYWAAVQVEHVKDFLQAQYNADQTEANVERLSNLFKISTLADGWCSTCSEHHIRGIVRQHNCQYGDEISIRINERGCAKQMEQAMHSAVLAVLGLMKKSIEREKADQVCSAGLNKSSKRKASGAANKTRSGRPNKTARLAEEARLRSLLSLELAW